MLPEINLIGKTAIVTGASRGIGRSIAVVLAEAGADIVLAARTTAGLDETAELVEDFGREAISVPTDIARSKEVDAMVDRALERFGKVDILVNNAGLFSRIPVVPLPGAELAPPYVTRDPFIRTSDAEWNDIIDTNLNGVFYCCRAVAPHMMKRRYGKIINISSNNGVQAFPLVAAYNSSKAAVSMLTRVLALEWAPYNICVNAIGPGEYDTDMTHLTWVDPQGRKSHLDGIPFHREGDLRDIGVLATYLASPATDYMTGQIIYIDGGLTAK